MRYASSEKVAAVKGIIEKLREFAAKRGVDSTTLIDAKDIFVEEFVRQECEFGCEG